MREIKFRVWDCDEMFYNCTVGGFNETNTSVYSQDKGWMECTEKSITMQYTGLKDKNGEEIYEGDIVEVNTFEEGNIRRLVIYDAPGFWLAKDNIDKISVFAFSTPNIHETIIGNIYENPELLHN